MTLSNFKILKLSNTAKSPSKTGPIHTLYARTQGTLKSKQCTLVPTNIKQAFPDTHFACLKTSYSHIKGLGGVVDSDYRGEVNMLLFNGGNDCLYSEGEEVGKMFFVKTYQGELLLVDSFDD